MGKTASNKKVTTSKTAQRSQFSENCFQFSEKQKHVKKNSSEIGNLQQLSTVYISHNSEERGQDKLYILLAAKPNY